MSIEEVPVGSEASEEARVFGLLLEVLVDREKLASMVPGIVEHAIAVLWTEDGFFF